MRPNPARLLATFSLAFALTACSSHRPPGDEETVRAGGHAVEGLASWYGPGFHGRTTASGEVYDSNELTCAHRSFPFGTRLLVRNVANDRTVWVRVNDRGPFVAGRVIDLSYSAAEALDLVRPGTGRVRLTPGRQEEPAPALAAIAVSAPPGPETLPPRVSEVAPLPPDTDLDRTATTLNGSWSVQVGAFAIAENAEGQARDLTRRGIPAHVVQEGALAKVRVGSFADEAAATAMADSLRREGLGAIIVSEAP